MKCAVVDGMVVTEGRRADQSVAGKKGVGVDLVNGIAKALAQGEVPLAIQVLMGEDSVVVMTKPVVHCAMAAEGETACSDRMRHGKPEKAHEGYSDQS